MFPCLVLCRHEGGLCKLRLQQAGALAKGKPGPHDPVSRVSHFSEEPSESPPNFAEVTGMLGRHRWSPTLLARALPRRNTDPPLHRGTKGTWMVQQMGQIAL